MRSVRIETIFYTGILIIILITIVIQITNFDDTSRFQLEQKVQIYSSRTADKKHREVKNVPQQPEITIGIFEALRGTCFLPENGDVPYAYDENKNDRFQDIQNILIRLNLDQSTSANENETLAELTGLNIDDDGDSLSEFYKGISRFELYPKNSKIVDKVLYDMATWPITKIQQMEGGTQFKLKVYFNEIVAIFKPMRMKRDEQPPPNQLYFAEFERHNAEIAAFHVDRVLGSRHAMPVVGRKFNIITDIIRLADKSLQRSVFISKAKNICFIGDCEIYCDIMHPICADKDIIEGSLCAFFPEFEGADRESLQHPWNRTYDPTDVAPWEMDKDYCESIKNVSPFDTDNLLTELIEMSIFDFLIGNQDRHNFQRFEAFGNNTFTLRYDHGRAFGRAFHDELRILAPLIQCCMIRPSTVETLLKLHNGPKGLSALVLKSMSKDPLAPILWEPHFEALDRRLSIVLQSIRDCMNRKSIDQIFQTEKKIKILKRNMK